MSVRLRQDAEQIIRESIARVLPDAAVIKALENKEFADGKVYLAAVGKAAWQMARAATAQLGDKLERGIVVTKYGHVKGSLDRVQCYEGGHPVPDENSFRGTEAILAMTAELKEEDTVLFLLSGGGSALFEQPLVSLEELQDITGQLLASGADIVEMNTIRKRLSGVKGGKFALHCAPARIFSVVLSDIIGDPLDMIASGPACPDSSSAADALAIADKYHLQLSPQAKTLLEQETPKVIENTETIISGSVRELCASAAEECLNLGYEPFILTEQLNCEAREAGVFLSSVAKTYEKTKKNLAFIVGGETVVHVKGKGKGGRNQEMALAAADGLSGMFHAAFFSVGSDGTDGPTDAAGGYVDGSTKNLLVRKGADLYAYLEENNAYEALNLCDSLIITGPTGTNVNDLSVLLIRGQK